MKQFSLLSLSLYLCLSVSVCLYVCLCVCLSVCLSLSLYLSFFRFVFSISRTYRVILKGVKGENSYNLSYLFPSYRPSLILIIVTAT